MGFLKNTYRDLEQRTLNQLKEIVSNNDVESEYLSTNCIKLGKNSDYSEIAIVNDGLILIDSHGLHYNIFQLNLEDIIDIVEANTPDESFNVNDYIDELDEDMYNYLDKEDGTISESHLMGWFTKEYQHETEEVVLSKLKNIHDMSADYDVAEDELGRELTDREKELLKKCFIDAVINSIEFKHDIAIGFYDTCGDFNTKSN